MDGMEAFYEGDFNDHELGAIWRANENMFTVRYCELAGTALAQTA